MSLPFLLAGIMTAGIYFVNTRMAFNRQTQFGLALGRQVASQIEILALSARQRSEPDPITWAIQLLSISPEPRLIQLSKLEGGKTTDTEAEKYRLNVKHGNFLYSKVLDSQSGTGVKVHLHLGYIGFLGSTTPLGSDFWTLCLFFVIFGFLFKLIASSYDSSHSIHLDDEIRRRDYKNALDHTIQQWTDEARTGLKLLGLNLKQVIQQAQKLASAASKSRDQVEILAQNSTELSDGNKQAIQIAQNSFGELFQVTQTLNDSISKTTESLLTEARLLQELKNRITSLDTPSNQS
jgi:hypothetical protein